MKKVVGIGEVLWDILPEGKKLGGAPTNFAYHVTQFGLPGCVVSAIGNDNLGKEVVDIFASTGLHHITPVVQYPTGTVVVKLDDAGVPEYDIKEDVAWDNIPFSPELDALAKDTCAVCFGSLAQRNIISRETINKFLDNMPDDRGVLKVFDVNLRREYYDKEIICNSLRKCNVLKINDEELVTVGGVLGLKGADFRAGCSNLMEEYNIRILILTCGIDGSYVFTDEGISYQPTPVVEVEDTVGAGDSFTAAFISCILKGKTVAEAHSCAVKTSAYVCTQKGAMPVLPEQLVS